MTARPVVLSSSLVTRTCLAAGLLALTGAAALGAGSTSSLQPLEVSPAMHAWVEAELGEARAPLPPPPPPSEGLGRLRRLQALLTGESPTRIQEVAEPTPTAAEAFEGRRADCVGFALLVVALARDRGVPAQFLLSLRIERTSRQGTLRIRRGHLAATYSGRVFDFVGERAFDPRQDSLLSDRTAIALFLSNRGAQSLLAGRPDDAVELFYQSMRFDPSIPYVWSNLGVALHRGGDAVGAVLAQEMALRLDPVDESARRNLALARSSAGSEPPSGPVGKPPRLRPRRR